MRKVTLTAVGLACLGCLSWAQVSESERNKRLRQYPQVLEAYELAQVVPPGLRAIALNRLASLPGFADRKWKREMLIESFEAAARYTQRWPVGYVAMTEVHAGGRPPGRVARAEQRNSGLDALSLQSGAVRMMSSVDIEEAVRMFQRMSNEDIPQLLCKDDLYPILDAYFEASGVLARTLTVSSDGEKKATAIISSALATIVSPLQVGPAARLLEVYKNTRPVPVEVTGAFAARILTLRADSRAFFATLASTNDSVLLLASSLPPNEARTVLDPWRAHILANIESSERCPDTLDPTNIYFRWERTSIDRYNAIARRDGRLSVIELSTTQGRPAGTPFDDDVPVETEAEAALRRQWLSLMFGNQRNALTESQKKSVSWKERFDEYVNTVESLHLEAGASETLQKQSSLMAGAVMLAVPGEQRTRVIERYASLLEAAGPPDPDRVHLWYSSLTGFLDLIRQSEGSNASLAVATALNTSGNAPLELVGRLELLRNLGIVGSGDPLH
jgi:hypothetical protein